MLLIEIDILAIALIVISFGPAAYPILQPVIEYALLTPFIVNTLFHFKLSIWAIVKNFWKNIEISYVTCS